MSNEDEQRLFKDLVDWSYTQAPSGRPEGWSPDEDRGPEELMRELSALEINERRLIARNREEAREEGQRTVLVRLAERQFGADTGRRLDDRLRSMSDPVVFEKVGDLILDCDDGEQLLSGINGMPRG